MSKLRGLGLVCSYILFTMYSMLHKNIDLSREPILEPLMALVVFLVLYYAFGLFASIWSSMVILGLLICVKYIFSENDYFWYCLSGMAIMGLFIKHEKNAS